MHHGNGSVQEWAVLPSCEDEARKILSHGPDGCLCLFAPPATAGADVYTHFLISPWKRSSRLGSWEASVDRLSRIAVGAPFASECDIPVRAHGTLQRGKLTVAVRAVNRHSAGRSSQRSRWQRASKVLSCLTNQGIVFLTARRGSSFLAFVQVLFWIDRPL